MDLQLILLGVLPAVLFVVLAYRQSKRTAIAGALALAVLELIYTLVRFGRPDALTITSFALAGALGLLSLWRNDELYFKFYPALQSAAFAGTFLFLYFALDRPIMLYALEKYVGPNWVDQVPAIVPPAFMKHYLSLISRDMGFWFLGHTVVAAYTAWHSSRPVWLLIAVFGQLAVMVLGVLGAGLQAYSALPPGM